MMPSWLLNDEPVDLSEFLDANVLDFAEIMLLENLRPGESYTGGGGASAEWTLTRDKNPLC